MKSGETILVYVIQMGDTNYYKIGITNNLNNRLRSLQTGNPLPLHAIATIQLNCQGYTRTPEWLTRQLEKELHEYFCYCQAVGEWFEFKIGEEEIFKKYAQEYIINTTSALTQFKNYVNTQIGIKIDKYLEEKGFK